MKLSLLDTVIVLAYLVGIFALAQWVSREKRGHKKDAEDYFLAAKALPWWAIGTSLIAANISAEQIIGMSGSGYALGLAIASYEWMAAPTLLIVGKFFLPVFLRNGIATMPQFLQNRYGTRIRTVMAVFWLILYVFVNLTSILWLGSIAVSQVTGIDQFTALVLLGTFSLAYQLYGGLKAVALTDFVQVGLLVAGGLAITTLTLSHIGAHGSLIDGFRQLRELHPDHFHMILGPDNPFYKDLPGLSVLIGGLWVMNLSYWGFNQYIIQRGLAAKSVKEAQNGVLLAAFLKLLVPLIVVVPGIAAVMLAPGLAKPDQAYPTMMGLLPSGLLGLVFAALIAAVMASLASKINSIATIFTLDFYSKFAPNSSKTKTVLVGRMTSIIAVAIGILSAKPLLGSFDQAFQYIQDFTGYFTPGVTVIFLLGLFWKPANENGALAAAIGSVALSIAVRIWLPAMPFMNRVGWVFVASLVLAIAVSLLFPKTRSTDEIVLNDVSFRTSTVFNIGALAILAILLVLYTNFW
jgi:SSS family solute:Na+ symporter